MTNDADGGILGSRGFNSAGLCVDLFSKMHRQHIKSVAAVTVRASIVSGDVHGFEARRGPR